MGLGLNKATISLRDGGSTLGFMSCAGTCDASIVVTGSQLQRALRHRSCVSPARR